MKGTPNEIFSLCCPKREEEWIDGWNENTYRLLCSKSGFNEKNCVFQECSLKPFLFGKPGPTTWITTSFEPERFSLDFMLIFGDAAVINRRVLVEALSSNDVSACHWTDTVTFLGKPPVGLKRMILSGKLALFSHSLGYLMKHYCDKGRALAIPRPLSRNVLRAIEQPEMLPTSDDFTNLNTEESIQKLVSKYSDLIAWDCVVSEARHNEPPIESKVLSD
jgi:hypothetical protein